jgi:hypothetical protein
VAAQRGRIRKRHNPGGEEMSNNKYPKRLPFKACNEKGIALKRVFLEKGIIVTARSVNFEVKRLQRVSLTDFKGNRFATGIVTSQEHYRWDDFLKIATQRFKDAGFETAQGWVKAFVRMHRNRIPERVQVLVIEKEK